MIDFADIHSPPYESTHSTEGPGVNRDDPSFKIQYFN